MFDKEIKKRAAEIQKQGKEPPVRHRERFEQRLKERQELGMTIKSLEEQETGLAVSEPLGQLYSKSRKVLLKRIVAVATAAAVIIGFIFLGDFSTEKPQETILADVRNYYHMQLEEQIDATKLLIQNMVHEEQKTILLANIETIEQELVPDVQMTDDEYIILIADVYISKIEVLQNLQNIIKDNI